MKTKQILFTAPGVAELTDKEIGEPGDNEVRVRLAVSTISSGTERANLIGDPNVGNRVGKSDFPRILGYSSAGTVEAVGKMWKICSPETGLQCPGLFIAQL